MGDLEVLEVFLDLDGLEVILGIDVGLGFGVSVGGRLVEPEQIS